MDFRLQVLGNELASGKKKPIPFPLRSIDQAQILGEKYDRTHSRYLFYLLYLSGQRISEALFLDRFDVNVQDKEGQEFIVINSITEKNQHQPRRSIAIPMFGREKGMSEFVWNWVDMVREGPIFKSITGGRLSRNNSWNILSKLSIDTLAINPSDRKIIDIKMKVFPHYLRHCRASHLAMFYGYDLFKLMQYFGWSGPDVATVYASMNWESLAEPFLKKV